MEFPRHWVSESAEARRPDGRSVPFRCWGWSDENLAAARAKAREVAAAIGARIQRGEGFPERYGYDGGRPLREEVLRELCGGNGSRSLVTRNSYGCEVLNAERVMFVDRDDSPGSLGGIFRRLFGRGEPDPALAPAERLVEANPGWGIRVYRTAAGARYLLTHELFDPRAASTEELMRSLGADPRYVQLCRTQACFRARLTPKPWRCGLSRPPGRWPWADASEERAMRAWLSDYGQAAAEFAVCRLVAEVGSSRVAREAAPVLAAHDEATRVGTELTLA